MSENINEKQPGTGKIISRKQQGNRMSYWKLSVEGFGKIKKAEIELAPMTLFVGDNNSGKSYLLSLAWAMHQLSDELFQLQAVREMQSRVICTK